MVCWVAAATIHGFVSHESHMTVSSCVLLAPCLTAKSQCLSESVSKIGICWCRSGTNCLKMSTDSNTNRQGIDEPGQPEAAALPMDQIQSMIAGTIQAAMPSLGNVISTGVIVSLSVSPSLKKSTHPTLHVHYYINSHYLL